MIIIDCGNEGVDLSCSSFGYTIPGAADAIAVAYDIPENNVRTNIIEGITRGSLKIRDQNGFPRQGSTVDMKNDRVSILDLNAYFSQQKIPYRLNDPFIKINEEFGAVKSNAKLKKGPSLTDRRIDAIVAKANELGFPPLAIPFGGKKVIEISCENDAKASNSHLFNAVDGFRLAWNEADLRGVICVANKDKYNGHKSRSK